MKIAISGGTGTVGRHAVRIAAGRGHDVVVLSRARGVDLVSGRGLDDELQGVQVVVDLASRQTQKSAESREFFRATTSNLLRAEERAGVDHHVTLSVVGSDRAPYGYYAGKVLQEELVTAGPVAWTLLRATQFHEFAAQLLGQITVGPVNLVPVMTSQPIAASEVADRLVDLAERGPAGRVPDLAGPEILRMVDMVRAYARAVGSRGPVLAVPLPGALGRAMRDGTLTAADDSAADRGYLTFASWLAQQVDSAVTTTG